jgi:hypothetical protein
MGQHLVRADPPRRRGAAPALVLALAFMVVRGFAMVNVAGAATEREPRTAHRSPCP